MIELQKLFHYMNEEVFPDDGSEEDTPNWKKVFQSQIDRTPQLKNEEELLEFEINLIERDVKMTIRDIVENQGLCFQEHKVTTEDGYILTIHRVATDFT